MKKCTGRVLLFYSCLTISVFLTGCSRVKSISNFNDWLNDPEHGCIVQRQIAGIELKVKYLPPSYMVLREVEREKNPGNIQKLKDSLLRQQGNFVTFLMTMSPDINIEKNKRVGSVMDEGITSYHDYVDRVITMNFSMDQHIELYTGNEFKRPTLSLVENLYELSDNRNFLLVFEKRKNEVSDTCTFVYNDPFFNLGEVQFRFLTKNMRDADLIKIN